MLVLSLSFLAAVVWPALAVQRPRSTLIQCLNNLSRIGQGFQLWAAEHEDRFPWTVPSSEGGALGGSGINAAALFKIAARQFGSTKFLVCPASYSKASASSFEFFYYINLSYFAGLHANLNRPRLWLSGDENITGLEGQYCRLARINSTRVGLDTRSAWDTWNHYRSGNVLFGDGSAVSISNLQLTNCVARAVAEDPEGFMDILKPF